MGNLSREDFQNLKKNIVKKANKETKVLSWIVFIFVIIIFSSPFIFIWFTWSIAWKVGLTGIIGFSILNRFYEQVKEGIITKGMEEFQDSENVNKTEENIANFKKTGCTDFCGNPECLQYCKDKEIVSRFLLTNQDYTDFIKRSNYKIGLYILSDRIKGSGVYIYLELIDFNEKDTERYEAGKALINELQDAARTYHQVRLYANGKVIY